MNSPINVKIISRALVVIGAITILFISADAQRCVSYEPANVTLLGRLYSKVFPGPPNYESIRNGDRKETAIILKLEARTCTTGDERPGYNVSSTDLSEMQLVIYNGKEWKIADRLMGKRVAVTGELFPANTGHHRTAVLISVGAIRAARTTDPPLGTYPAVWFAPVEDPNKPDWEILPQEAKAGEVILSKRNELGILSNFAATPFVLDGKRYASVEGFWQMMLYPEGTSDERRVTGGKYGKAVVWNYTREQVAQMTAFEAKSPGRWPRRT